MDLNFTKRLLHVSVLTISKLVLKQYSFSTLSYFCCVGIFNNRITKLKFGAISLTPNMEVKNHTKL